MIENLTALIICWNSTHIYKAIKCLGIETLSIITNLTHMSMKGGHQTRAGRWAILATVIRLAKDRNAHVFTLVHKYVLNNLVAKLVSK